MSGEFSVGNWFISVNFIGIKIIKFKIDVAIWFWNIFSSVKLVLKFIHGSLHGREL